MDADGGREMLEEVIRAISVRQPSGFLPRAANKSSARINRYPIVWYPLLRFAAIRASTGTLSST